jgi:nucleoside-diphosphate-sugar epimerase
MVLITGGTGILGMRMVYDLLLRGEEVRIFSRKGADKAMFIKVLTFYHDGNIDSIIDKLSWAEGDIMDMNSIHEAVIDCQQVIHAAATVSFHPSEADAMYLNNKQGTTHVVDVCNEAGKRLLYISSVAALGRTAGKKLVNETSTWKDGPLNSNYAISKYNAELEVWRGIEEGLDAVMVNPSIILGAGSMKRSSGTLYGSVLQGNPFYTDGMATAVDVRDVSSMAIDLLFSPISAERYILHSEQISYKDMFQCMADSLGKKGPSIKANRALLSIGWRIMWVVDKLFKTKSKLTKETASSSLNDFDYSVEKVKGVLKKEFIPVREAIAYHAAFYRPLDS